MHWAAVVFQHWLGRECVPELGDVATLALPQRVFVFRGQLSKGCDHWASSQGLVNSQPLLVASEVQSPGLAQVSDVEVGVVSRRPNTDFPSVLVVLVSHLYFVYVLDVILEFASCLRVSLVKNALRVGDWRSCSQNRSSCYCLVEFSAFLLGLRLVVVAARIERSHCLTALAGVLGHEALTRAVNDMQVATEVTGLLVCVLGNVCWFLR